MQGKGQEATNHSERENEQEKWKQDLTLIEAALYVAGRPLDLSTLGSVIKIHSKTRVQQLARTLMEDYRKRDTALKYYSWRINASFFN